MAEQFESWKDSIEKFLEGKRVSKEEQYLKELIKAIAGFYKNDNKKKEFLDKKKEKKESNIAFLIEQFNEINTWEHPENLSFSKIKSAYLEKKDKIAYEYTPEVWLDWASDNAESVNFATHVAKLTHSAVDSISFYDNLTVNLTSQLTTSSINNPIIDGAVKGNQYAPIFQFLELEVNGQKLAEQFVNQNCIVLKPFTTSSEKLKSWNIGFSKALNCNGITAHSLLKQVYFPIDKNNNYHLLCNLVSSSMAEEIFEHIKLKQKEVVDNKKNNKFSEQVLTKYPKIANLGVTASNHGNASQLNGKRGGKLKLFSCQPPTWRTKLKPPIYKRSLFNESSLYWQAKTDIEYLRDFLLRFEKIDLSIKDPKRKKWVNNWVENIIDEVFFYISAIQTLPSGWSDTSGIKLKLEHQYLLDPYRNNNCFQAARKNTDWQSVICKDFSGWLNYKLVGKKKQFTPQTIHSRIWYKLFESALREFNSNIDLDLVNQTEEKI